MMQAAAKSRGMHPINATPMDRLVHLVKGLLKPPPGRRRIAIAFTYGLFCHVVFALAVFAMVASMYLLMQFPVMHSLLLSRRGRGFLKGCAPSGYADTLSTTTYAIVASLQLLALFALWTPSGIVWWRAEGGALALVTAAYAMAWLLLVKASYDAGAEVRSIPLDGGCGAARA